MPSSSIKNEKLYQDLRKEGNSKEKAARISHAAARGKFAVGKKGGRIRVLRRLDDARTKEASQGARAVGLFRAHERQADRQATQSLKPGCPGKLAVPGKPACQTNSCRSPAAIAPLRNQCVSCVNR